MPATLTHPPHTIDQERARALFPQVIETFVCPNDACGSEIRQDYIHKKTDKTTGVRTVTACCQDCQGIYRIRQIREGGIYRTVGGVELVTSARDRQAMLNRIDELQGTVHLDRR